MRPRVPAFALLLLSAGAAPMLAGEPEAAARAAAIEPAARRGHRFACADYTQGRVFVVGEDGHATWETDAPSANDLWVLSGGNLLFTTGHGVTEMTPDKKVVFRYESESDIFACQRLADGKTLVGESSTGRLLEVDADGHVAKTVSLLPEGVRGDHAFMRNARRLANGHYLVALYRDQLVREYDADGAVVWEGKAPGGAHSVARLPDGHTLVSTGDRDHREPALYEFDAGGQVVWTVSNEDLPDRPFRFLGGFHRLTNGNTVVSNWLGHGQIGRAPLLLEITPDKKVVWRFEDHALLRTASTVIVLDAPADAVLGQVLH
jgi:hypothetical protein